MRSLPNLARSYLFHRIDGGEFKRELILALADVDSDDKDALARIAHGIIDACAPAGEDV